jgi:hypothetical protein
MPECRQCKSPSTIKAHIIPASFTHLARDGEKNLAQVSMRGGPQTQSGIWDPGILCQACDGVLGRYDAYTIAFIRHQQDVAPKEYRPFNVDDADVAKLLRFAMAVIWRASLSDRHEFKHVDLGPYEEKFRQTLFDEAPLPTAFETLIFRYQSATHPTHQFIRLPVVRKHNGARYYDFIAAGWNFIIKVGQAPLSFEMQHFALRENSTAFVSANMPFEGTKDESALKYLAKLTRERKLRDRPQPSHP